MSVPRIGSSGGAIGGNPGSDDASSLPTHSDIQQLWQRYEATKITDQAKNALLEDLLTRHDDLLRKHHRYLEAHRQEHGDTQSSAETSKYWNVQAVYLQQLLNQNAYVILLIDGDSLIFNDNFLRQGESGGQQAATLLHNAIVEGFLPTLSDCPADAKICVRVFADVQALGDICTRGGIVMAPRQLQDFARGFSGARLSFDFVDVGTGRHAATSKAIDAFKLNIGDYHCRQVLLGCGAAHKYSRLMDHFNDAHSRKRYTIVDAPPFTNTFGNVQMHKFPGMFCESTIPIPAQPDDPRSRVDSRIGLNGGSAVFTPSPSCTSSATQSPLRNTTNTEADGRPRDLSSGSVIAPHGQNNAFTWAAVTTKNAHKPLTGLARLPPSPEPEPQKLIQRNKKGQRVDMPLEYDRDEVQRIKKLKSCNQHYIGNGCCHFNAGKRDKCPHNHQYKFSSMDLKHLRVVARETPCKRGHECEDVKCIYGHQCPFPMATEGSMRGIGCLNGDTCRFPRSMHSMDLAPVKVIKVAGTF